MAITWFPLRSEFFLGPKSRFLVQNFDFCHTNPILVNDPFLALGMTVYFPPWERFFDFLFRSYSCFRKKIRLTCKMSSPFPLWGHCLPVTALVVSARGLENIFPINFFGTSPTSSWRKELWWGRGYLGFIVFYCIWFYLVSFAFIWIYLVVFGCIWLYLMILGCISSANSPIRREEMWWGVISWIAWIAKVCPILPPSGSFVQMV